MCAHTHTQTHTHAHTQLQTQNWLHGQKLNFIEFSAVCAAEQKPEEAEFSSQALPLSAGSLQWKKTLPRLWLLNNFLKHISWSSLIIKYLTDGLCLISQFILAFSVCNMAEWTSRSFFLTTCYWAGEKVGPEVSKHFSHMWQLWETLLSSSDLVDVTHSMFLWSC